MLSDIQSTSPISDLCEGTSLPKIRATLRPYQVEGYHWLAGHYAAGTGACLADDMGLGKTPQTIALLAAAHQKLLPSPAPKIPGAIVPHLIVLPPSLVFNWAAELAKFAPDLTVCQYTGAARSLADAMRHHVVLTTYDTIARDIAKLTKRAFNAIIFDEAQALKNPTSARTRAARKLHGHFRLALTGTPLENHIGEFATIMDLVHPGLLHSGIAAARPYLLRRTKEAILDDLPPKTETDHYLDLTPHQKSLYARCVSHTRQEIRDAYDHKPQQVASITALAALMKLRQTCISPGLAGSPETAVPPKFAHLTSQLQELATTGQATLVFSQFTTALDALEPHLAKAKIPHLRLDGSTPIPKRKHLVQQFQSGFGPAVFLISLKAGGSGLNLTRASHVFHLDPWWNPAVENQASDRAHRIGQKNPVFVHRLLMRHTIEEKMMALKKRKAALYDAVMATTSTGTAKFDRADIDYLLAG